MRSYLPPKHTAWSGTEGEVKKRETKRPRSQSCFVRCSFWAAKCQPQTFHIHNLPKPRRAAFCYLTASRYETHNEELREACTAPAALHHPEPAVPQPAPLCPTMLWHLCGKWKSCKGQHMLVYVWKMCPLHQSCWFSTVPLQVFVAFYLFCKPSFFSRKYWLYWLTWQLLLAYFISL